MMNIFKPYKVVYEDGSTKRFSKKEFLEELSKGNLKDATLKDLYWINQVALIDAIGEFVLWSVIGYVGTSISINLIYSYLNKGNS